MRIQAARAEPLHQRPRPRRAGGGIDQPAAQRRLGQPARGRARELVALGRLEQRVRERGLAIRVRARTV